MCKSLVSLRFVFILLILFTSTNLIYAQWKQTTNAYTNGLFGPYIYSLFVNPNTSGGANLFIDTPVSGIFLSTNNGASWTESVSPELNSYVNSFSVIGSNLFAGSSGNGVFISTNEGTSWTTINSGLNGYDLFVKSLAVIGTNLFVGTIDGVFLSSNNGASWIGVNSGLLFPSINSFAVSPNGIGGTNLFAGSDIGGVYLSTDNGANWRAVNYGFPSLHSIDITSFAVRLNGLGGADLFAGTTEGIYLSTNNGTSWTDSGLTNHDITSLAISTSEKGETNLFAGTYDNGVYLSTNMGMNWTVVNYGFTDIDLYITALAVSGMNLFAGTRNGLWVRSISDMITSVKTVVSASPTEFSLEQNYPNPFNPATTINYSVPKSGLVTIKVYDILGRELANLVNEQKNAGSYSIQFNAAKLASGVYFYRMQAEPSGGSGQSFVKTKKLLLLK